MGVKYPSLVEKNSLLLSFNCFLNSRYTANGYLDNLGGLQRFNRRREMKKGRFFRGLVVSLATLGMCLPEVTFAAAPQLPAVVDVALADGGVLHGQVVDLQGTGVSGVPVSVKDKDRDIAVATTAKDGKFSVQGLKGGVYRLAAGQGQGIFRLWSAKTAPPAAQNNAVVYTQLGTGGGMKMLLANPIVIAGVVATAIAVPIAVVNSNPSSP
jgi:hypothetical protein